MVADGPWKGIPEWVRNNNGPDEELYVFLILKVREPIPDIQGGFLKMDHLFAIMKLMGEWVARNI